MINIVIPMAGLGSRFPSHLYPVPKPLIPINGVPMILRALDGLLVAGEMVHYHFIIAKTPHTEEIKETLRTYFHTLAPKYDRQYNFLEIDYITEGPACSALLLKERINNQHKLIIANCDQIMEWNFQHFLYSAGYYDGCIVTYTTNTPKNSYAKVDSRGFVIEVREKEVISDISLNGIHYWRSGKYFVESAERMIAGGDQNRAPNGEFYIGPTYNEMIAANHWVGIYHIPNQMHHPVGTPEDLDTYTNLQHQRKIREANEAFSKFVGGISYGYS